MSFSVRYVFAILFVIFSMAVVICAQSTTAQTSKAPRGTVSGRITIKDKGAPGVAVGLRKNEMGVLDQSFSSRRLRPSRTGSHGFRNGECTN
jgi:Cu/Zn superoxide dismutase